MNKEECPLYEAKKHMDTNGKTKLTPNSYLSIGIVIMIISCTVWINTSLVSLQYGLKRLEEMNSDQKRYFDEKITSITAHPPSDSWTELDQVKWATALQHDNPNMKIPEPRHRE